MRVVRELPRCDALIYHPYIWGLVREEEDEQIGNYNQTMTTEALRIKLDNLQREVQSLQVENRKLRTATERDQGKESHVALEASAYSSEIEDLRQRLVEAEERSISLEHEAQQWKETVEQVETGAKQRLTNLQEQLEEKAKVVEQLISKDSERQLEIDKLCNEHQLEIDKVCAENKALKERLRGKSQLPPNVGEQASAHEASLRHNVTELSCPSQGAMSPLLSSLSFSSLASVNSNGIGSSVGVAGSPIPTSMPAVTSTPLTDTFTVGLNSATRPFGWSHGTRQTNFPHSTLYHPPVLSSGSPMQYQVGQPVGAAPSVLFGNQMPPVSKYSGNADSEPFEEWLEQFELVASVCNWEGRAKLANLVTRLQGHAYSYYRTCSTHQRTSYDALKNALSKRFKPVRKAKTSRNCRRICAGPE